MWQAQPGKKKISIIYRESQMLCNHTVIKHHRDLIDWLHWLLFNLNHRLHDNLREMVRRTKGCKICTKTHTHTCIPTCLSAEHCHSLSESRAGDDTTADTTPIPPSSKNKQSLIDTRPLPTPTPQQGSRIWNTLPTVTRRNYYWAEAIRELCGVLIMKWKLLNG